MKYFHPLTLLAIYCLTISVPFVIVDGHSQPHYDIYGIPLASILFLFVVSPSLITYVINSHSLPFPTYAAPLVLYLIFLVPLRFDMISELIYLFGIITCLVFFSFLYHFQSRSSQLCKLKSQAKIFALVTLFVAAIGFFRWLTGIAYDTSVFPICNRNEANIFMYLLVTINASLFVLTKLRISLASVISGIATIVFSGSRSGLIAVVVSAFLFLIYVKNIKVWPRILALFGFVIVLLVFSCSPSYLRLSEHTGLDAASNLVSGTEISKSSYDLRRTLLIERAGNVIMSNPLFGVGVGLNNYIHAASYQMPIDNQLHLARPHNLPLSLIAQLGAVPLLITVVLPLTILANRFVVINPFLIPCSFGLATLLFFNEYFNVPFLWASLGVLTSISIEKK